MAFFIILLSAIVMSAGFAVLHFSLTHYSIELKASGWTLVIAGLLSIVGVFYYVPMTQPPYEGHVYYRNHFDSGMWPSSDGPHPQCPMAAHKNRTK